MGKIWDYIYGRLPLGKGNFYTRIDDLEREFLEKVDQIQRQLNFRIDSLQTENNRLIEENRQLEAIVTNYHKQDLQMFWQLYCKADESVEEAKKRFFASLPVSTGITRDLQMLENILLNALATVCENNKLPYWLGFGTLLGAVRHKGFIPWDDDIDIGMMREDVDRLIEILKNDDKYCVTVRYDAIGQCKQVRFTFKDEKLPVFVDIFMFDWCKNDSKEIWNQNQECRINLLSEISDDSKTVIQDFKSKWIIEANSKLGNAIAEIFDKYYDRLLNNHVVVEEEASGGIVYGFDNCTIVDDSNIMSKDVYFPLQKLEFEGRMYNVPNKYIHVLNELYGSDIYTFPLGAPHFIHADWKKYRNELKAEIKKRKE